MPNWCSNTLTVTGSIEDLIAWDKAAHAKETDEGNYLKIPTLCPLDFESIVPIPEDSLFSHGDDARVAAWGTKWNLDEVYEYTFEGNCILYRFQTAWSPPDEFVKSASALFPNLDFHLTYSEGMMGIEGDFAAKSGEVTLDDEREFVWEEEEDYIEDE